MVWFQCEDCGENLKKPKLQGHFRICSAYKLSCIDCGETFNQQSVQGHTQCISEAEKYGPKGQGKTSNATPAKPKNESKKNLDIDINVGLSSHPPWFCSLCNTNTTSKQTLLLHAEGKKHRAKARAFHASQQNPSQTEESTANEKDAVNVHSSEYSTEEQGIETIDEKKGSDPPKAAAVSRLEAEKESLLMKKRKFDTSGNGGNGDTEGRSDLNNNGEVIQAEREEAEPRKKNKHTNSMLQNEDQPGIVGSPKEATNQKIKWKKLITSILKSSPDGAMKIRKLRKLVSKALQESGITQDEAQFQDMLMHKEVQEVNASMNEQTLSARTLKRWEMADLQFLEDSKGNPCEFCRNSLFNFLETCRCWSWICEDYHHVQVQYRLSGCTYSLVLLLF